MQLIQAMGPTARLLSLSFKHAWRNRRRTLLIAFCVLIGNLVMIFQLAQGRGQEKAFMDNMIHSMSGHIELVRSNGKTNFSLFEAKIQDALPLPAVDGLEQVLQSTQHVTAYTRRIRFGSMFARDEDTWSGFVMGVQPEKEREVCGALKIASGRFVKSGQNEIVISAAMARDQNLKIGDEVALLTSTANRSFNGMEFRIVGFLSDTGLSKFFSRIAYIPIDRAQQLIGVDKDQVYEEVVLVDQTKNTDSVAAAIKSSVDYKKYDGVKVLTWRELGGIFIGILSLGKVFRAVMAAFLSIVILILVFSSFSVYVHERGREMATLMAIGLRKWELGLLFVAEGAWIALLGSFAGLLIGGGGSWWLSKVGIPAFNDAMQYAFAGDRLYPIVTAGDILSLMLVSCAIAAIAALMPVRRMLKKDMTKMLNRS